MQNEIRHLKTKLGYTIATTIFKAKTPKGVVVISSATGVKQSYYADFSSYLKSKNFTVYTFDYNGIGKSNSENIKNIKSTAYNWGGNDFDAVLNYAIKKNPKQPIIVFGHSIGGQLIGLSAASSKINTLILVASQSGYWKLWKGFEKIKMFLFWYIIIPLFSNIFGYFPGKKLGIMENLPKTMTLEWKNWCKNPNYLFDVIPKDKLYYLNISAKLISYSTDFDNFAPQNAVDILTKKYANAKILRKHLNPNKLNISRIGHFGFFKKKFQIPIWEMFLEDINNLSSI